MEIIGKHWVVRKKLKKNVRSCHMSYVEKHAVKKVFFPFGLVARPLLRFNG